MPPVTVAPRRGTRRFAVLYAIAWLPYIAVYASAMAFSGEAPVHLAILTGAAQAVPAALLGLIVLRVCRRVAWEPERRRRFFAIHAGVGLTYAMSASLGSGILFWLIFLKMGLATEMMQGAEVSFMAIFAWQSFMGLMVYTTLTSITYAFHSIGRLQEERARAARANALRVEAELNALRAQLNPHFLFNTLHSLISLVRSDPDGAEDAIEQFADLMRYASRVQEETRDLVALSEELEFVQNYLALESLRLGDRLTTHLEVAGDTHEAQVPAFSLQPLVENAVRHGIASRATGGTAWITVSSMDDTLRLEVRDDGPGADPTTIGQNGRMGLKLVRQRLEALYGERASLTIDTAPDQGFRVCVSLPIGDEHPLTMGNA